MEAVRSLADGTEDFDAVNVRQLRSLVNFFGGGATFIGGVFTAPTFTIQGSNFNTVAAAFAAVDSRLKVRMISSPSVITAGVTRR